MLRHSATVTAAVMVLISLCYSVCAQEGVVPLEVVVSNALLDAAKAKYRAQDYDDAAELLVQSIEKWPENSDAVYWLAQTREKQGRGEDAAKLYRQYLKLTEGEGRTPERVLAGMRARKLDEKYENLMALKEQVLLDAKALLATYGDDLSPVEKTALEALVGVLEGKAVKDPSEQRPEKEKAAPRPRTVGPGKVIDLIEVFGQEERDLRGGWSRTKEGISARMGKYGYSLILPVIPKGSYEIQIGFTRLATEKEIGVLLPAGPRNRVMFVLSDRAGLNEVNGHGMGSGRNPDVPTAIQNGKPYVLQLRVILKGGVTSIEGWLDGKKIYAWRGPKGHLRSESLGILFRGIPADCYSLALRVGYQARAHFYSVKLRMLSGEAEILP